MARLNEPLECRQLAVDLAVRHAGYRAALFRHVVNGAVPGGEVYAFRATVVSF